MNEKFSDLASWLLLYLLLVLFSFGAPLVLAVLSLFYIFAFVIIKSDEKEKPVKQETLASQESAIMTMLEYYVEAEVIQWCISTYKWAKHYATEIVQKLNKIKNDKVD